MIILKIVTVIMVTIMTVMMVVIVTLMMVVIVIVTIVTPTLSLPKIAREKVLRGTLCSLRKFSTA